MTLPTPPLGAQTDDRVISLLQMQVVASLTAAIVSAAGRPYSIQDVLALNTDISFALFPKNGLGTYEDWKKTKAERLAKVHGATS